MEKVNLRDLWKISKTENKALLGDSTSLANLEFMEEYLENYAKLDRQLILDKGFFQPIWNLQYEEDAEDVLDQFQDDAAGFIWKNKDSYQRIFDVLSAEYEPLWNYDKTSEITDQESGTDATTRDIGARHSEDNFAQRQDSQQYGAVSHTDVIGQRQDTNAFGEKQLTDVYGAVSETDVIGQRQDTNLYGAKENTNAYGQKQLTDLYGAVSTSDTIGARSDSVTHGAQSETDTIGAVNNSDIYGAKSGTSENEIAGFNSGTYNDSDKTSTSETTHTDQHTEAQRTNGHSTTQYSDQTSIGAQTNGHTENSKTDTHTDAQHTDTITEGTHTDTLTQGQQSNTHSELSKTDTHTDATHTDTITQGQQTNTHGENARTDTLTQGAHKDEHDTNAAQDIDRIAYGHKNTHNERTTGNIGVMSTQDLINQELRLRIASKFYDILFNDIVKNLCSYYDEGYDCF